MATIKYTILKKGQSLRCYREGYPTTSYKNLLFDIKVEIEESLERYYLQISSKDRGTIITIVCDRFEIQEAENA